MGFKHLPGLLLSYKGTQQPVSLPYLLSQISRHQFLPSGSPGGAEASLGVWIGREGPVPAGWGESSLALSKPQSGLGNLSGSLAALPEGSWESGAWFKS